MIKWNEPSETDFDFSEGKKMITKNSRDKIFCKESYANELLALYDQSNITDSPLHEGKIIGQVGQLVLVDTNGKYTLPVKLDSLEADYFRDKKIGDEMSIAILPNKGEFVASAYQYNQIKYFDVINEAMLNNYPVEVKVVSNSHKGYIVDFWGVKMILPHILSDINKPAFPDALIGNSYKVLIDSYSHKSGEFLVSRKRYMESQQAERLESLVRGNVYTGTVTGSTSYGVFVQFEEVLTGMIHKDSIQEAWRDRLHEIVPGTQIDFYFREALQNGKIIITQYWKESLWDRVEIGQIIDGKVEKEKPYYWRIRLDWDTCGNISKTELEKWNRTLKLDERVKVQVVEVQPARRKIRVQLV